MKRFTLPASCVLVFTLPAGTLSAQEGSPWMHATAEVTHAESGEVEHRTTVYQDAGDAVLFFTCGAEASGRPSVTAVISTVQIDPTIALDGDRVSFEWTPANDGATLILSRADAFVSALREGDELLVGYSMFELAALDEALRPLPCHVAD